jgi:hypothetical protein
MASDPSVPPAIPPPHQSFLLSLWAEVEDGNLWVWRGVFQGADGKKLYFHTLADLNRLLRERGGWRDPSDAPPSVRAP